MYRILKLNESAKLNENETEEYWDAKELVRDGFMSLMKFNFGSDSKGNNYIIIVDANDVKRFHANDDDEAKRMYDDFKRDWNNSDHGDLTANVKSIAPRNESVKLKEKKNSYRLEETENLKGYTLLLRAAKEHLDELYDTDDLYNLIDRLSVDDEESPEDFSDEEVQKLQVYLDTIPQEDIYRCWDEVHGFDLGESQKLTEADEEDELRDNLESGEDTKEDEERIEDIEDNQEETLDSEEDQEENPVEEESTLDTQLDELRDILVDLDNIRLYKVVSQDNEEFYILGKVAEDSNDVEMLVDTQPIDYEGEQNSEETVDLTPEDIQQKYQFVSLPLKFEDIRDMNPKYGEDLEPNHEELVSYLMNLLIEQNPEAAEEAKDEEVPIEEPENDEFSEVPEEINSEEEEDEE